MLMLVEAAPLFPRDPAPCQSKHTAKLRGAFWRKTSHIKFVLWLLCVAKNWIAPFITSTTQFTDSDVGPFCLPNPSVFWDITAKELFQMGPYLPKLLYKVKNGTFLWFTDTVYCLHTVYYGLNRWTSRRLKLCNFCGWLKITNFWGASICHYIPTTTNLL